MTVARSPIRIGAVAADVLTHMGEAEVVAVFDRSFYLAVPHGLVCIGGEAIGDGPLNVLLPHQQMRAPWSDLGVSREAKGAVTADMLFIGDRFALRLAGAPVWHPPPWPSTSPALLAESLASLRAPALAHCPAEGLAGLVFGSPRGHNASARAAAATVAALRTALARQAAADGPSPDLVRAATLLLGLGPGLTPSGDDMLGGLFLAISALGCQRLRDGLWEALAQELDLLTVPISAMHLSAAADGMGTASLHAALCALLTADVASFGAHLASLAEIGHTSGFDTLAGMVLALESAIARGA